MLCPVVSFSSPSCQQQPQPACLKIHSKPGHGSKLPCLPFDFPTSKKTRNFVKQRQTPPTSFSWTPFFPVCLVVFPRVFLVSAWPSVPPFSSQKGARFMSRLVAGLLPEVPEVGLAQAVEAGDVAVGLRSHVLGARCCRAFFCYFFYFSVAKSGSMKATSSKLGWETLGFSTTAHLEGRKTCLDKMNQSLEDRQLDL